MRKQNSANNFENLIRTNQASAKKIILLMLDLFES
jgi:hypothetical protein